MEFIDDGTIKTLIPDMRGVGYLAASKRPAEFWHYSRIFMLPVRNLPYFRGQYRNATQSTVAGKGSVKSYTRTHTYQATHVADESNGTRWMALIRIAVRLLQSI